MGWVGVVPVALLLWPRRQLTTIDERRNWLTVAAVFAMWAMGPFLTMGGADTGLKLPELVVQFIPIVSNAHMPGRAIVGVYLALATLVGFRVARAAGPLQRARVQWLLIALLIVEYTVAPIPLTTLDVPLIYRQLAREPAGAVCEVPFGISDGLGVGNIGSQDHAVLYYATVHAHPLVGGYVGRMPRDAAQTYASLPVTRTLLRLSGGDPPDVTSVPGSEPTAGSPCTYLVLDRARASSELVTYIQSLPVTLLASSDGRDLFRLDSAHTATSGGAPESPPDTDSRPADRRQCRGPLLQLQMGSGHCHAMSLACVASPVYFGAPFLRTVIDDAK
jgi:hypothetical protein